MRQVAGPLDPSPMDRREAALARRWRGLPAGIPSLLYLLAWGAVLAVVGVAVGLLMAKVVDHDAIGRADAGVERFLAAHRTSGWNSVTHYVTDTAETLTIATLAVLTVAGAALVWRRWREPALVVAGEDIAKATGVSGTLQDVWGVLRWPAALVLLVVAVALLFRASPRRRQPAASWLAAGSALSVVLGLGFTWLLSLYLSASTTFGQTYGPLAGMIGVLVWAFMMSLALLFGLAFAAQLEAVRAGASTPVTGEKVNRTARAAVR